MSYNTKALKTDVSGVKPAPQHFNSGLDDYDVSLGRNGASRAELYGPDGTALKSTEGKLDIRASEIETFLEAIEHKGFATQNILTQILEKITNGIPLSGSSIPEYGWVDGDTEPTPTQFAFGAKINPINGSVISMYWNGTAWAEVV
jgi:hypothetical protein